MTIPQPSREFRFVAACCRAAFEAGTIHQIEPAIVRVAELDWPLVLRLARFHRVQGLMSKGLGKTKASLPADVGAALAGDSQAIAAHNLKAMLGCRVLAKELQLADLPFLHVKGLTLAQLAYGESLSKVGADIDILVPQDQILRCARILSGLGYELTDPPPAIDFARLRSWHKTQKESQWRHIGSALQVDLHSRLADNPRLIPAIDTHSPQQMVEVSCGTVLPTLADEQMFAYLAVHGSSSAWFRLKWITDFTAFIHAKGTDRLEEFYSHSLKLSAGRAGGQALLLADKVFGLLSDFPRLRTELARDWKNRWLADLAFTQLVHRREPAEPTKQIFGTARIHYSQLAIGRGAIFPLSELARQLNAFLIRAKVRIRLRRPSNSNASLDNNDSVGRR